MQTIAHISDLHLLEDSWRRRDTGGRARLSYLSFGRPLDELDRRARLSQMFSRIRAHGFDHVLLTGDLTEDGHDLQFEVLGELLDESGIAPERITILPGNHDFYIDGGAWRRALAGPLRRYRRSCEENKVVRLGDVSLLPLSSAVHQSCFRSGGLLSQEAMTSLINVLADAKRRSFPVLFALHHPPTRRPFAPYHWVDGLRQADEVTARLVECPLAYVVHGHTHHATDRALVRGERPRVFSCKATVESNEGLRFYEASWRGLVPVTIERETGFGCTVPAQTALAS